MVILSKSDKGDEGAGSAGKRKPRNDHFCSLLSLLCQNRAPGALLGQRIKGVLKRVLDLSVVAQLRTPAVQAGIK